MEIKDEREVEAVLKEQRKIIEELKKKIEEQEVIISAYQEEFKEYRKSIGKDEAFFITADFWSVDDIKVELNLPEKEYKYSWLFNPLKWLKMVWINTAAHYNTYYNILSEKWGFEKQGDIVVPSKLLDVENALKDLTDKYKYGRHTVLNNERFWDDFEKIIENVKLYIELNAVGRDMFSSLHTITSIQISSLVRILNRYVYKVEGVEIIAGEKNIEVPSGEEEKEEYKKIDIEEVEEDKNKSEEEIEEPIPEEVDENG